MKLERAQKFPFAQFLFGGQIVWLPWALMAIVLAAVLSVGIIDTGGEPSDAERATSLSRTIRCPQCQGETVADSNVAIAAAIRADIRERVDRGESNSEIRQYYADQYGDSVLLTPPGEGLAISLWVIPVVAVVAGAVILVLAWQFRRPRDAEERARIFSEKRWQVVAVVIVALAVATVAGIFLAREVGFRSSTSEATGDIRQSSRGLLVEAGEFNERGDFLGAIEIYDQVLEQEPSNEVALSYKGWLIWLTDEINRWQEILQADAASETAADTASEVAGYLESERLLDEAVAIDVEYPDARVFRAIIYTRTNRWRQAQSELQVLDTLEPAASLMTIVEGSGIRDEISYAVGVQDAILAAFQLTADPETEPTPEEVSEALSGFTNEQLYQAGQALTQLALSEQRYEQPTLVILNYLRERLALQNNENSS